MRTLVATLWSFSLMALIGGSTLALAQDTVDNILAAVVGVRSQVPAQARTARSLGTERAGSGVVIDGNGLILTIGYLIMEAEQVSVELDEEQQVPADIVAYDYATGFGLLRARQPLHRSPMPLGSASDLQRTDQVLVVSHGGENAVRPAYVVSRRNFAGYWEYLLEDAIFTSPPHPQFGGAALIGPDGNLLGIGSLVVRDALRTQGENLPGNMFVPIDALEPIFAELLDRGRSSEPLRPWLGIYSEEHRGRLFITRVAEDGPAAQAGITPDTMVLGVAGNPVRGLEDFYRQIWAQGGPGTEITLNLLPRGGEPFDVVVQSGDRYDWLQLE